MSYSIIFFYKIFTLAIAPFLFISFGILLEFAMVLDVYILLLSFPGGIDMHIWQYSHQKHLNHCLLLCYFS